MSIGVITHRIEELDGFPAGSTPPRRKDPHRICHLLRTPAQRDNIRTLLTDEMRESGSTSEGGTALKALIDRLGRV